MFSRTVKAASMLLAATALTFSGLAAGAGSAAAQTGPACTYYSPSNGSFSCTGPNWSHIQNYTTYTGTWNITNNSSGPITITGGTDSNDFMTMQMNGVPSQGVTLQPGQTHGFSVTTHVLGASKYQGASGVPGYVPIDFSANFSSGGPGITGGVNYQSR
ncbi:MAG: hypothetical protein ACYDH5_17540 [Acidimicrobiales bacterium]